MNPNLALARPEIRALKPYSYAAWDHRYERLHANENPWRASGDTSELGLNLYPESPALALHSRLAELYGVALDQVLAGRGSDEGIDLLIRSFCRAGVDRILTCPPTFGYYRVAAEVQGAGVVEVPLRRAPDHFTLDADAVLAACAGDRHIKLIFLCSPGNPSATAIGTEQIVTLAQQLNGRALVVVDEAYIEFAPQPSLLSALARHPNMVILRTLSKAYALAGARCGTVIADPEIIELLGRVIPPYAIPTSTVETVLTATAPANRGRIAEQIQTLLSEREQLANALRRSPLIKQVFRSDANFLLVECVDADVVFNAAMSVGLVVRDQRKQPQCANCLRISIGSPEQNARLLQGIRSAEPKA